MTREDNRVKWVDVFGYENLLIVGRNGDVFHVIPECKDEEGDSYVRILSKQAIIEMAALLNNEMRSMIPWIKYDPENPPKVDRDYLVSDGSDVEVAHFQYCCDDEPPQWYPPDLGSIDAPHITHYAHIKLPGEETEE